MVINAFKVAKDIILTFQAYSSHNSVHLLCKPRVPGPRVTMVFFCTNWQRIRTLVSPGSDWGIIKKMNQKLYIHVCPAKHGTPRGMTSHLVCAFHAPSTYLPSLYPTHNFLLSVTWDAPSSYFECLLHATLQEHSTKRQGTIIVCCVILGGG